jgi:hypothetical protein
MINRFKTLNVISILLLLLMTSCSAPSENGEIANKNSSPQTSPSEPSVAQSGTPTATSNANVSTSQPPGVQSLPVQPADKPAGESAKPGEKAVTESAAAKEPGPRLLVPDKKLDFGKQPQDKTLARTFKIKNVGTANLQIESVTPS